MAQLEPGGALGGTFWTVTIPCQSTVYIEANDVESDDQRAYPIG